MTNYIVSMTEFTVKSHYWRQ